MADVISSIGTGGGRDYTTVQEWHDDWNGAAGGAGNVAIGELYADSDFTAGGVFTDTTPDNAILRCADGHECEGVEDNGVRFLMGSDAVLFDIQTSIVVEVIGIEVDANGHVDDSGANSGIFALSGAEHVVQRVMIHNASASGFNEGVTGIGVGFNDDAIIARCAIYDFSVSGGGSGNNSYGIFCNGSGTIVDIESCTIYQIGASNVANAIAFGNSAGGSATNNTAVAGCSDDCVTGSAPIGESDGNASDDSTITGETDPPIIESTTDTWVSDTDPFDLHLKAGSTLIDVAGVLHAKALLDITLFDVANDGDNDPDIGAYEFQAAPVGFTGRSAILGGGMFA